MNNETTELYSAEIQTGIRIQCKIEREREEKGIERKIKTREKNYENSWDLF